MYAPEGRVLLDRQHFEAGCLEFACYGRVPAALGRHLQIHLVAVRVAFAGLVGDALGP